MLDRRNSQQKVAEMFHSRLKPRVILNFRCNLAIYVVETWHFASSETDSNYEADFTGYHCKKEEHSLPKAVKDKGVEKQSQLPDDHGHR